MISEVADTGGADEMVLIWANALVEIGHIFLYIAAFTSVSFFSVWLESLEELVLSWAGQTLTTDIEIASITACEEKILLLGNRTMANVTI